MSDDRVRRLVQRLAESRKYGAITPDVLTWAIQHALPRSRGDKDVLKRAKRSLHQAFGAYLDGNERKKILSWLREAVEAQDDRQWLRRLEAVLATHASSAERVDSVEEIWAHVRAMTEPIHSVLDIGCGVAPAGLPWSGLDSEVHYEGIDLDVELCDALEHALRPRWPNTRVRAADIRQDRQWPPADVVLLWKLLPTLERQQAGASRALLGRLRARWIVATFPTRTLGGHGRGMETHYTRMVDVLFPEDRRTLHIGSELVVVARGPGSASPSGPP